MILRNSIGLFCTPGFGKSIFSLRILKMCRLKITWKDRLKGEVHFLHAYFYHNLVRLYGGVPLVPKAYGLKDDFTIFQSYVTGKYRLCRQRM